MGKNYEQKMSDKGNKAYEHKTFQVKNHQGRCHLFQDLPQKSGSTGFSLGKTLPAKTRTRERSLKNALSLQTFCSSVVPRVLWL